MCSQSSVKLAMQIISFSVVQSFNKRVSFSLAFLSIHLIPAGFCSIVLHCPELSMEETNWSTVESVVSLDTPTTPSGGWTILKVQKKKV